MSPATLRVKRGDTLSRVFTWQDANGVAIDLSGCLARLQVRDRDDTVVVSVTSATSALEIEPTIGETDTTGKVYLTIDASTMALLDPGTYAADLELTFPDGTVRSTDTIHLIVQRDITV